jgi:Ca-activated chloride channel family protein
MMKLPTAWIPILALSAGLPAPWAWSAQQTQPEPVGAGEVITIPAVQTIVPQRRAPRPFAPDWQPVEVKSVDAEALILGETARTTLAVTLFNPSTRTARCELAVPVPPGAAISAFQLDGLEGDPPSRLLPRDEARKAFEEIVRKMIDPGLLEFAGSGLIRSSVFPVPPNGEQTFRVTYEHPVKGSGDTLEYTLPRSGSMGAGPEWTVDVRIEASSPILNAFSPSHAVEFAIDENGVATLDEVSLRDPGPFRFVALRAPSDAANAPAMSLFTYPDPDSVDAGFFMLVMAAGERGDDEAPLPREVTLVLDRSGSMQGEKFEQATEAALQVIRALGPEERFRIIDYASEVATSGEAVNATPEAIAAAAARLGQLKAVGGTNINEALMEAVRPDPTPGTLPIVLFLTDGLPTVGVTAEKSIRENILRANARGDAGARRLFTFGVGHDVNVPLLTDLARESRAIADFVNPTEDVEAAVGRVFERLHGPVLADLRLRTGSGPDAETIRDLYPRQLGDLFEDQRLVALGRYRVPRGGFELVVTGNAGDGEHTIRVPLDPADASPANSHIARLWAQQKVTWLIDELRSAGADSRVQQLENLGDDPKLKELIDEIVMLSTKYGILTEYTAFLATEKGVLAAGQSPEFDLNAIFQGTNRVRAGGGGVALGEAQNLRRDAVTAGRPMSIQDNYEIAARTADEANDSARGGASYFSAPPSHAAIGLDTAQGTQGMTLQQIGPDTLYRQGARWVDSGVIRQDQARAQNEAKPQPDETVAFATDRYFEIAQRLVAQNRQGLMAVPGEVEILLDGRRILLQNPA